MKSTQALSTAIAATVILLTGCSDLIPKPTATPSTAKADEAVANWRKCTASAEEEAKNGHKEEAERLYLEAMQSAEQLGQREREYAYSMSNLANFYYAQGDGGRADQLYKKSIALKEELFGKEDLELSKDLVGLAGVYVSAENYKDALPLYTRAVAILEKNSSTKLDGANPVKDELAKAKAAYSDCLSKSKSAK